MTAADAVTELVTVRGADAVSYVDSQCTQDLSALEVGGVAETLVLQPNGDLVAVAVARRPAVDVVTLEVPAGTGAPTAARLERFAIRAAVAFEGPSRGSSASPSFASELDRIKAAVPGAAEVARGLVAHGLGESLRARCVSFTKGCYPGQELVARMEARDATPPYVLRRCTLGGGAAAGDAIGDASRDGVVTSVARDEGSGLWWALCVVHRKDAASPTADVHAATPTVARFE